MNVAAAALFARPLCFLRWTCLMMVDDPEDDEFFLVQTPKSKAPTAFDDSATDVDSLFSSISNKSIDRAIQETVDHFAQNSPTVASATKKSKSCSSSSSRSSRSSRTSRKDSCQRKSSSSPDRDIDLKSMSSFDGSAFMDDASTSNHSRRSRKHSTAARSSPRKSESSRKHKSAVDSRSVLRRSKSMDASEIVEDDEHKDRHRNRSRSPSVARRKKDSRRSSQSEHESVRSSRTRGHREEDQQHRRHRDESRTRSPSWNHRHRDESRTRSPKGRRESRKEDQTHRHRDESLVSTKRGRRESHNHTTHKAENRARSPSVANRRREAAKNRGDEGFPATEDSNKEFVSPRKSSSERPRETPSRRRTTIAGTDAGSVSRSRSSQIREKRSQWKEHQQIKKDTSKTSSDIDDVLDEKVQRRQSMLETSKRGSIRASASRQRGLGFGDGDDDDDDEDDCSVSTYGSYLTADSDLDLSVATEAQRRSSCTYLPSGLAGVALQNNLGRRASVFGSGLDRARAIYSAPSNDDEDDDSDDESISSRSSYMPAGLSKATSFDVDRADHNGTSKSSRRPSMSSAPMVVPIIDDQPKTSLRRSFSGSVAASQAEAAAPTRSESRSRRGRERTREDASTLDKGVEDLLRNRRLRGDSVSRTRNQYAQEEKEEEQYRMVDPLKMLSTVGAASFKGLSSVTSASIQGISTVSNVGLKGVCTVGNAGLNVSKQTVNASIKGISTVGNAGLNVSKQTVNAGLNVSKQTVKGISTVSRQSVKGVQNVSDTLLQRKHEAPALDSS